MTQGEEALRLELDRLVAIDEQRNEHTATLQRLQSQRDTQVGRMQVIAEQQEVDLEAFVGAELEKRRGNRIVTPPLREKQSRGVETESL